MEYFRYADFVLFFCNDGNTRAFELTKMIVVQIESRLSIEKDDEDGHEC